MPCPRPFVARRTVLTGSAALAGGTAVGMLTACGSSDRRTRDSARGSTDGPFPVRLQDSYGTVQVKTRPGRIVCVGRTDHDVLLALGRKPTALYRFVPVMTNGVGEWARAALGDARPTVLTKPLDYERIAGLSPDLILDVQSLRDDKQHRTLNAIAPTIGLPKDAAPNAVTWQQSAHFIATAVGEADQGAGLVDRVEATLKDRAAANPRFADTSVAVLLAFGNQIGVYSRGDSRMQLLSGLGFTPSPFVQKLNSEQYFTELSAERLSDVDADLVVVLDQQGSTGAQVRSRFPTLAAMPASRAGRAVYVEDFQVSLALASASVLSIPFAVRSLEPLLRRALT